MTTIILPWAVGEPTGWGHVGLNLALALRRLGVPVELPNGLDSHVSPIFDSTLTLHPPADGPRLLLQPLGNVCMPATAIPDRFGADRVVGWAMIESTTLTDSQVANLMTYDLVLTGCQWNCDTLHAHGIETAVACPQGIDTLSFRPGRQRPWRSPTDPFLIFSGGKFEYRKGHDLVIECFKRFRSVFPRIPATLVIAWHNVWPNTVGPLHHTGYLTSLPPFDPDTHTFGFVPWLETQGIPSTDVIDAGYQTPATLSALVRECDAGLFLSRAESANNLPLGECLASGLPVVMSPSTGQLDYDATDPLLLTLTQTTATKFAPHPYTGLRGWVESDPFEAALALEAIASSPPLHADRTAFAETWCWDTRARALLALLDISAPSVVSSP